MKVLKSKLFLTDFFSIISFSFQSNLLNSSHFTYYFFSHLNKNKYCFTCLYLKQLLLYKYIFEVKRYKLITFLKTSLVFFLYTHQRLNTNVNTFAINTSLTMLLLCFTFYFTITKALYICIKKLLLIVLIFYKSYNQKTYVILFNL